MMRNIFLILLTGVLLSPSCMALTMQGAGDRILDTEVVQKAKAEKLRKKKELLTTESILKTSISVAGKHNYTANKTASVMTTSSWWFPSYTTVSVDETTSNSTAGNFSVALEQYHYLSRHFALGYGFSGTLKRLNISAPGPLPNEAYPTHKTKELWITPIYLGTKIRFGITGTNYWYVFGQGGVNVGGFLVQSSDGKLGKFYSFGLGKKHKNLFWEISYARSQDRSAADDYLLDFRYNSTYNQVLLSVGFEL